MKVALYVRVSSDAQDVNLSIGAQLRALKEYAEKHGYIIVREFVDEAESGRTSARPAFREMIALAKTKEPPFEMILVWKLNRFSRNRIDSITFKELLRKRGISVVSINEPLENNPSGKLLEGIIEGMDEFYSANLGQDIRRGLREAAEGLFFVGRLPPYGFHKVKVMDKGKLRNKLEPDAADSSSVLAVKLAFSLALKGLGTKEIAKALNKESHRTSTGSLWTKTYVYKVLTNEAYCGTLILGGRPGYEASRSGELPVIKENAWPSIVDKESFLAVQHKMSSRRPTAVHPRVLPSFYLLSGIIFCSCGRAMIGRSAKSHQFYYYTCNRKYKEGSESCHARSLPKNKLEQIVTEHIRNKILDGDTLEKLVILVNQDLDKAHFSYADKLKVLGADIRDANARLTKLYDALETGKLELNDLAPRIKELKARQDELLKLRGLLESDMELHGVQRVDAAQVKAYCADLRSLLSDTDIVKSKAFLRSFIEKIIIYGNKCTIYYKLPIPVTWHESDDLVLPIEPFGGAEGIRTPGLRDANATLSQLSYSPNTLVIITQTETVN
jgi:site-specific DNA recombinase